MCSRTRSYTHCTRSYTHSVLHRLVRREQMITEIGYRTLDYLNLRTAHVTVSLDVTSLYL